MNILSYKYNFVKQNFNSFHLLFRDCFLYLTLFLILNRFYYNTHNLLLFSQISYKISSIFIKFLSQ